MTKEKKPKILCAGYDKSNIKLLRDVLVPEGYEFHSTESGETAISHIANDPPDIVILDIILPDMSGIEVLQKLRADDKAHLIPVVMLSARTKTAEKVQSFEVGCDDFISKPFDCNELVARVKSLVKAKAYNDQMQRYERSLAEEMAQRTKNLWRALKEKERANLETIYRLSRASEYRDADTGAHILRVGYLARTISRKISLKDKFTEDIFHASPMHDIGKIGIPDAILLKPGKFNAVEWEIMKGHTVIGAEILKNSKVGFIKMAETIALTHHERWDGSGYPVGLSGVKIPLPGRIVAVVDVFDAVTSNRPYRDAFPVEAAFEIIKEGSGSHFDPYIVSAFFACQKDIVKLKEKHKDQEKVLSSRILKRRRHRKCP